MQLYKEQFKANSLRASTVETLRGKLYKIIKNNIVSCYNFAGGNNPYGTSLKECKSGLELLQIVTLPIKGRVRLWHQ